jgi:Cu(I)/Ag(I) efflux system membrane fusion protein/cobalt-zinc-cadmium efflux system membrane fusion protein
MKYNKINNRIAAVLGIFVLAAFGFFFLAGGTANAQCCSMTGHGSHSMSGHGNHAAADKNSNNPIIREGVIDLRKIDEDKDGFVFQDPMHWNVISDKPGTCPICKMELAKVSLSDARKNLKDNNFKVEPLDK